MRGQRWDTQLCAAGSSLARGILSRVRYAYGLLLSPDEFTDEQDYYLDKTKHHDDLLHDYGSGVFGKVTRPLRCGATAVRRMRRRAVVLISR